MQILKNSAVCANGSTVNTMSEVNIPFYIQRQRFSATFTILENASSHVYLGLPFLNKYNAVINFPTNSIALSVQNPVHSKQHVIIPALSEVVLQATLHESVLDNKQGECYVFPSLSERVCLLRDQPTLFTTIQSVLGFSTQQV